MNLNIFTLNNIKVGWSLYWRLLPLFVTASLASRLSNKLTYNEGILTSVDLTIIIIAMFLFIMLLDYFGRKVGKIYYGSDIKKFIGWSIFWRSLFLHVLLSIACIIAILPLFYLTKRRSIIAPFASLFNLSQYIIFVVSIGWAANRVFRSFINKDSA